jgi:hypothetical protein
MPNERENRMKFTVVPSTFDRNAFYHGTPEKRLELAEWLINYLQKFTPGMYSYLETQAAGQAMSAATKVKKEAQRELRLEAKYYNELAEMYL